MIATAILTTACFILMIFFGPDPSLTLALIDPGNILEVNRFKGPVFNETCASIHATARVIYKNKKYEHVIMYQEASTGSGTKLASFTARDNRVTSTNKHSDMVTGMQADVNSRNATMDIKIKGSAPCLFGTFSFYESDEKFNYQPSGNREMRTAPPDFKAINFSRPDVLFALNTYINATLRNATAKIQKLADSLQKRLQLKTNMNILLRRIIPPKCIKGIVGFETYSVIEVPGKRDILCDTKTDNGGWIVIQRRINGLVNFDRSYFEYMRGFGSFDGDFWIGNDFLSELTSTNTHNTSWEIRLDATYGDKKIYTVNWPFHVGNYSTNYTLKLGGEGFGYSDGYQNDFFTHRSRDAYFLHNTQFSTRDRDHDRHTSRNCAKRSGGFWYNRCAALAPNGMWKGKPSGITLYSYTGWDNSLDTIELKIRRRDVPSHPPFPEKL